MSFNSSLLLDIEAADVNVRYDESIKQLLANKEILAWIMKYCVDEFKDYAIDDIIPCIEKDADVANRRVEPGLSNKIIGDTNENPVPNEGKIAYDVIFHAKTKDDNGVEVIINVEAQNNYYPGYDLETRGVFYCARMLSAQANREFSLAGREYKKLKKVYSIWICTNSPDHLANTISSYEMTHKVVYGSEDIRTGRYDLLEVAMIRLKEGVDNGNELHRMLNVLLSSDTPVGEKERRLQDEFSIEMTEEFRTEVENVCNLSLGVEQKGAIEMLVRIVSDKMESTKCSFEEAIKDLPISASEKEQVKERLGIE